MNSFKQDKILGYALLPVLGECFDLSKEQITQMFKSQNKDLETSILDEYFKEEFIEDVEKKLVSDSMMVQSDQNSSTTSKVEEKKEEVAPPPQEEAVDFSSFF